VCAIFVATAFITPQASLGLTRARYPELATYERCMSCVKPHALADATSHFRLMATIAFIVVGLLVAIAVAAAMSFRGGRSRSHATVRTVSAVLIGIAVPIALLMLLGMAMYSGFA